MRKLSLLCLLVLTVTVGLLAGCQSQGGADATNTPQQPSSGGTTGSSNAPTTAQPSLAQ